jgi:hypothetical protein
VSIWGWVEGWKISSYRRRVALVVLDEHCLLEGIAELTQHLILQAQIEHIGFEIIIIRLGLKVRTK